MSLNTLNDQMKSTPDLRGKKVIGVVVNNQDPAGQNLFQVKIPGLFEEGELPWIGIQKSSPFGVGPGFGTYGAPAVGALANIEFQDGDIHKPICTGFTLHQMHVDERFANGNVWGYVDPNGTSLVVDTGAKTWTWTHVSGTTYTVDAAGNLSGTVVGNVNFQINGNTTINTNGNTGINTQGSTTITSGNGTVVNTTGNTDVTTTGQAHLQANGVTIESPTTTITGTTIVEGLLRVMAGITVTGDTGSGHSAEFTGNVNHTDGLFVSNDVSISGHEHPYDDGTTEPPIPGT